jgi:hypothetical protein
MLDQTVFLNNLFLSHYEMLTLRETLCRKESVEESHMQ